MRSLLVPREVKTLSESNARLKRRKIMMQWVVTVTAIAIASVWLMPLAYAGVTSLKTRSQATEPPILPSEVITYEYDGKEVEVFLVPVDGAVEEWALVKKGRESSEFIDPANPDAGLIEWEGRWRTLEPVRELAFAWGNYPEAWEKINFPRLLFWTVLYATVTLFAAVGSSTLVAYGFARFRFRGKGLLFMVMMATIILPPAVTQVPSYAFFTWIGWTGTWLPLIVPQFFGNAYNVFLLRQYFLTIPAEMEQAAAVDGAGPIRTLVSVILPQAIPALTAVSLFHFFFAWNDFFGPLIYLVSSRELSTLR